MRLFLSALAIVGAVAIMPSPGWAGARPPAASGADSVTTTALAPMNNDQMRRKLLDACMLIMSAKDEPIKSASFSRCGCYSTTIMKDMSPSELDSLRTTGSFPSDARPKAQATLAACKLPAS